MAVLRNWPLLGSACGLEVIAKMSDMEKKIAEVRKNFTAFKKLLPSIDPRHSGKFAVLRKEEIIEYFDSMPDAAKYADVLYEDGLYSIQEVTARVIDLGIFSHLGTNVSG